MSRSGGIRLFDAIEPQVPTSGNARIAFVGEAPTTEDRLGGVPLIGASGRTLDQSLRVAKATAEDPEYPVSQFARHHARIIRNRARYFVTNVFDRQLPGDDPAKLCAPAGEAGKWEGYSLPRLGGNGYLRPEHSDNLVRLSRELAACQPILIVPLGSTALWAFTGETDIGNARGAVSLARFVAPGVKVLPTYHPSTVQKDWRLFSVTVKDIQKAMYEATFPELRQTARRIHIRPVVGDFAPWLERLEKADVITVDIETAGGQITCVGFGADESEAFITPFVDYEKPDRCYWDNTADEVQAWEFVERVCGLPQPKLLQNGTYDCYWFIRKMGIWLRNYSHDTRLEHHALYPELPKSLAFLGATYANAPPWKQMRHQNKAEFKRDD